MKLENEDKVKRVFPINRICIVLFLLPALFAFILMEDFVLAGVLLVVGLGCQIGFRTGALKALSSIGLVLFAIFVAPQYAYLVEPKFNEFYGLTGLTNRLVSITVISFGFGILLAALGAFFTWMFLEKDSAFDRGNRVTGMLIGGAECAIAAILLLGGIQIIAPNFDQASLKEASDRFETPSDIAFVTVANVAEKTKSSLIGPILEEHNPFTRYPEYNPLPKIEQTVQLLNNPSRINDMLNDESTLNHLQASPEFMDAVERLSVEPEIQKVLGSHKPPSLQQVFDLMNSQPILEILDEPGFMEEATRLLKDTSLVGPEIAEIR